MKPRRGKNEITNSKFKIGVARSGVLSTFGGLIILIAALMTLLLPVVVFAREGSEGVDFRGQRLDG